jgi:hypothetical protein
MIRWIATRIAAWTDPPDEALKKKRARRVFLGPFIAAALIAGAALFFYAGLLVGLFVDAFRLVS